jgi:hypothetical protein
MIAGLLLIHCVAEDAYYLLSGIVDGLMRDHFHGNGVSIDANVFAGVLGGSEKALSRKFKDLGIHRKSRVILFLPFSLSFILHPSSCLISPSFFLSFHPCLLCALYEFELMSSTTIPD